MESHLRSVVLGAAVLAALLLLTACGQPTSGSGVECLPGLDEVQVCGFQCTIGTDGAVVCADTPNGTCVLDPQGRAVCSQVMPEAVLLANAPPTECLLGSDGLAACGYSCGLDALGLAACANTPDGTCVPAPDGSLTCSQLTPQGFAATDGLAPPPECLIGANSAACGYNCELGALGLPNCSTVPNGTCAFNADGTLACP
jgi:hypothetical protein